MNKREGAVRALRRALPWVVLAGAFVLSLGFYALYGAHNLDADISSEMILASVLNEEGRLLPLTDGWFYSTELRVISPVPLYQLGLKLFASWHAARTFAVGGVLLLIALSALFMAREVGFGRGAPWLAAMLMLPISHTYTYIVIYGGFYALHLVLSLLLLGLIARYGRLGLRGGRGLAGLALIALLSLISGMGGVRMMTMLIVPLFGMAVLLMFAELKNLSTFAEGAHRPAARMAAASAVMALFAVIGYAVNVRLFIGRYRFHTYTNLEMVGLDVSGYLSHLREMLGDMGLRKGVPFYSAQGLAAMAVLAYFALICVALWRLKSRFAELSAAQRLYTLTAVTAVVLGMTLVIVLNQFMSRYYIVGTLMLLSLPFLAWEAEPCKNKTMKAGAFILLFGYFSLQSAGVMRYDFTQGKVNYEMAADWLLEHGYTQGYATFWNANTLTEASDGRIEMWSLEDGRLNQWMNLRLHDILQRADHERRDPDGRVFLLVDEGQNAVDAALLNEEHLVDFVAWSYYVYEYESVDEMREILAQGAQE